jgi:hypothetical protein
MSQENIISTKDNFDATINGFSMHGMVSGWIIYENLACP